MCFRSNAAESIFGAAASSSSVGATLVVAAAARDARFRFLSFLVAAEAGVAAAVAVEVPKKSSSDGKALVAAFAEVEATGSCFCWEGEFRVVSALHVSHSEQHRASELFT